MTFSKKDSLEARRELKQLFEELNTHTVFVVQRHVSRSGMQRQLDLYVLPGKKAVMSDNYQPYDGQVEPRRITYLVAQAIQWSYNESWDCLTVNGCGMDMHFHTVYTLSRVLYSGDKTINKHDQGYYLTHRTI